MKFFPSSNEGSRKPCPAFSNYMTSRETVEDARVFFALISIFALHNLGMYKLYTHRLCNLSVLCV